MRRRHESSDGHPHLGEELANVRVDRPAEHHGASIVPQLERAVVLGEPLVHPHRQVGRNVRDHEMRVLVKHGAQRVGPLIGTDEDVVDVLARHEQAADLDLLALIDRLERIERLVVRKHDDDRRNGGGRDPAGEQARKRFAEAFELRPDRAEAPLADRADDDEVRRVDADPLRLRRGTPRQEDGEHETCATQDPTHRGPALL